jgi:hypothetical protein
VCRTTAAEQILFVVCELRVPYKADANWNRSNQST